MQTMSDIVTKYLEITPNETCVSDYIIPTDTTEYTGYSNWYLSAALQQDTFYFPQSIGTTNQRSYPYNFSYGSLWPTPVITKNKKAEIELEDMPTKRSIRCPTKRKKVK